MCVRVCRRPLRRDAMPVVWDRRQRAPSQLILHDVELRYALVRHLGTRGTQRQSLLFCRASSSLLGHNRQAQPPPAQRLLGTALTSLSFMMRSLVPGSMFTLFRSTAIAS